MPPPYGTAADLVSLGRSVSKGDWWGALFDVVGFVPVAGDYIKGTRIIAKLNNLRKSLDVAVDALNQSFKKTKEIAAKYWDNIAKKNRKAYEEALKKCNGSKACKEKAAVKKGPQYQHTPASGKNGSWVGERRDGVWKPSDGSPPIIYKNGFPDYSPFSKGDVEIPMRGTKADFATANRAMREKLGDPGWKKPKGYTWHHKEDGVTMQLIPKRLHATGDGASTPHMGGASMYGNGSNATEF